MQAPSYCTWSLGVEPGDLEHIRDCLGRNHYLKVLPDDTLPGSEEMQADAPVLIWVGRRCLHMVSCEAPDAGRLAGVPCISVLDRDCSRDELAQAVNSGFPVLVGTENTERIHEILRHSLEGHNMRRAMERMDREIHLDRELLLRKSDVFAFLRDFVSRVSRGTDTLGILAEARDMLAELLPVVAMHTAVWGPEQDGAVSMHLYLDTAPEDEADCTAPSTVRAWTELLLGTATALAPFGGAEPCLSTHYNELSAYSGDEGEAPAPDMSRTLLLPLCAGETLCGVTALLLDEVQPLGRDQVTALDAAAAHLAVVLRACGDLERDEPLADVPMLRKRVAAAVAVPQ